MFDRLLMPVLVLALFGSSFAYAQGDASSVASPTEVTATEITTDAAPNSKTGKTYFWFTQWPNFVAKFDPVADRVVGKVELKNGIFFGMDVSHDKKKFFVITAQRYVVEVIDREKMEVVEEHPFTKDGWIQRVRSLRECPGGTHWYVRIDRVKVELDRHKIEESQWLYYNVAEKKIEKTMKDLPRAIRSGARISPDGKKWHVFGRDLKIIDPETLEEDGKIELSKPLYTGMNALRVRGADFFHGNNPNAYRMVYTMQDPVKTKRTLIGRLDLDLENRRVVNLREWGADPGIWRFHMDRDCKVGVGSTWGGRNSGRTRMVLYDLENGGMLSETWEEFRPRRNLTGISPDGTKIYVGGAGSDFLVFDRQFKRMKTVWLDGEIGGGFNAIVE